jgi:hypothetical protein
MTKYRPKTVIVDVIQWFKAGDYPHEEIVCGNVFINDYLMHSGDYIIIHPYRSPSVVSKEELERDWEKVEDNKQLKRRFYCMGTGIHTASYDEGLVPCENCTGTGKVEE